MKKLKKRLRIALPIIALLASVLAGSAHATTVNIDFNSGTLMSEVFYTEKGFRVLAIDSGMGINHLDIGDGTIIPPISPGVDNAIYLHGGEGPGKNGNAEEILIDNSGQAFHLLSLDVERLINDFFSPVGWEIVSSSGESKLLLSEGTANFVGSGWSNITYINIHSTIVPVLDDFLNFGILLDNVTLTAVPEPSTWFLFATGFAGLLGYGWRRKQHTA